MIPKQVLLELENRHFWIDIRARKQNEHRIILVEVKVFEKMPSPIEYLMSSVGQYVVYRAIIEASENPQHLYMAVPFWAYQTGILNEAIGQLVIAKLQLKLIVFNLEDEEIVQWIE